MTRALAASLAIAAGCGQPVTEALLTVEDADLVVPTDVDQVHIEVHEGGIAGGALLSSADVRPCAAGETGDGCKPFPFTVLFVPGADPSVPAWVDVIARQSGTEQLHDAFVLDFVPGVSLRYDLVLYRTCRNNPCAARGEVCGANGECLPIGGAPDGGASDGALDGAAVDLVGADLIVPPRRIFVAGGMNGAMGGVAGANALCNQVAQAHAWSAGGKYVALLATSTTEPLSSVKLDGGDRKIVRADGSLVSTDATFWSVHHLVTISQHADGSAASGFVWTGFSYTGHRTFAATPADYCNDWTDGSGATSSGAGNIDDTGFSTGPWAYDVSMAANGPAAIYCLEQ